MFDETHAKVFLQVLNQLFDLNCAFTNKGSQFEFCLLLAQIELDNKELKFENVTLMYDGMTLDQFIDREKVNRQRYIQDLKNLGLIKEVEKRFLIFMKRKHYDLNLQELISPKNRHIRDLIEARTKGRLDHHSEEATFLWDFCKYNYLEQVRMVSAGYRTGM